MLIAGQLILAFAVLPIVAFAQKLPSPDADPDIDKPVSAAIKAGFVAAISDRDPAVLMAAMDSGYAKRVTLSTGDVTQDQLNHLVKQLGSEKAAFRVAATRALGALGDRSAVGPLVERLEDKDSGVRRAAAATLGRLGDRSGVGPLVARLEDEDLKVRRVAAEALGALGDESAVGPLVARLGDENLGDVAAEALGALGVDKSALGALVDKWAVAPLIERLGDEASDVRFAAAEALGKLGDKSGVGPLVARLGDKAWNVRRIAAEALGALGDESAVGPLIERLGDEYSDVRAAAARALGKLGDRTAVGPLVARLGDKAWNVPRAAARALGALGDESAVGPLVARLGNENLGDVAAEALGKLGDKSGVGPLVARLGDEDWGVRRAAAEALGRLGDKSAVRPLVARLGDKDSNVRRAAAATLGALGDESAVGPLIERLGDEYSGVRAAAAEALGELGDKSAVGPLVARLGDENSYVRTVATEVLEAFGPLGRRETLHGLAHSYKDSHHYGRFLFFCYLLGDAEKPTRIAIEWLGRPGIRYPVETLRRKPVRAREILRSFSTLWKTSDEDKKALAALRKDLATRTVEVIQAVDWKEDDIPLLKQQASNLANFTQRHTINVVINSLERWNWLVRIGKLAGLHLLFWAGLISIYPNSPQIQAIFFWNPWVRRFVGIGYVGFLLTWLPYLRRKLFAPFGGSLLADANLDNFDSNAYFPGSHVKSKGGIDKPIRDAIPEIDGQIVLEGESGIGKTMFLRYLVQTDRRIAVYLPAGSCARGVMEAIQAKLHGLAGDDRFLRNLIYSGAIDVCIDGLNEVSADTRAKVTSFTESYFRGNIMIGTQPLEWDPPPAAKVYVVQPLAREKILEFLQSRYTDLPVDAEMTKENYLRACHEYTEKALDERQPREEFEANQRVLSNPMDLTVIAQMLARRKGPDLLHLQQQQYVVMSEDYERIHLTPFPLNRFADEVYQMRLTDRAVLPADQFPEEIACMERHKMVVKRHAGDPSRKEITWRFRHDKVMDFCIVQVFLNSGLAVKHLDDARFRGVYFLLAVLLPMDEAKKLREHLINYAADTKDHAVSDSFIQLLRSREQPISLGESQTP